MSYQKKVQDVLSKAGNCPVCKGIGKTIPDGPLKVGAKLPTCNACSGTGRSK
jgi:DnaJ-class molecular chaperone